jgi:hypothetical protein
MIRRLQLSVAMVVLLFGGLSVTAGTTFASTLAHRAVASVATGPITAVHPSGLPSGFEPGGQAQHPARMSTSTNGVTNDLQTGNWSGYALIGAPGTYTSVSSEWQQAGLLCTDPNSVQYASFWVGLDGVSSSSVEQTGTLGVCDGTTAQYYAWYEMYPNPPVYFNEPVGGLLFGSVVFSGTDTYTLTLQGLNYDWTQSVTVNQPGLDRSSAEIITEAPSSGTGILPLADFQRAQYRVSASDGAWLNTQNPTKVDMVDAAGTPMDTTVGIGIQGRFYTDWLSSS